VTDLEEVVITGQKRTGPIAAGPRGTVPVADTRSRAEHNAEEQYRAGSPVAWLNYIRELREQGKTRTADSEWERFVKTFPNYPSTKTTSRAQRRRLVSSALREVRAAEISTKYLRAVSHGEN
jgi:hypothetical protein